jgi:hypothetical protein
MITHIEDLPIRTFIDVVQNIESFSVTEKLDGANMQFGKDQNGIFASREQKKGKKYYSPDQWERASWCNGFRSAHQTINQVSHILHDSLDIGDSIDTEILFGHTPNTIRYSSSENFIVFLKPFSGAPNLSKLKQDLSETIHHSIELLTTKNGHSHVEMEHSQTWKFEEVPTHRNTMYRLVNKKSIQTVLQNIENFLSRDTCLSDFTVEDILNFSFIRKPYPMCKEEWNTLKYSVRILQGRYQDHLMEQKMLIKNILLQFVRTIKPKFSDGDNTGIEGIVLRNDNLIFKIVDKEFFTNNNKKVWKVREHIRDNIVNPTFADLAEVMNHKSLGLSGHRNRYLKKFHEDKHEAIQIITEDVKPDHINNKLIILNSRMKMLKNELNIFKKANEYDDDTHQKTLLNFADNFEYFRKMQMALSENNVREYMMLLTKTMEENNEK